ncbi:MAG: hypothetical protein AAB511_00860 [Patescibacteria group bacterium]
MNTVKDDLRRMNRSFARVLIARGRNMLPRPLRGKRLSVTAKIWHRWTVEAGERWIARGNAILAENQ